MSGGLRVRENVDILALACLVSEKWDSSFEGSIRRENENLSGSSVSQVMNLLSLKDRI